MENCTSIRGGKIPPAPAKVAVLGVEIEVQAGAQLADAFWEVCKEDIANDHRCDEWGLMAKYMARAWRCRREGNTSAAFLGALKTVSRLGATAETDLMQVNWK